MKRSEVNRAIAVAASAFAEAHIHLPPFASWRPSDWREHREVALELMNASLGWDVVEWRPGEFAKHGLVLFTLRNVLRTSESGPPDGYAEKVMLIRAGQETPMHKHLRKMEDLINRGGGDLIIELRVAPGDRVDRHVLVNGVSRSSVREGETVALSPGESITLPPRVIHAFYASGGDVIAGEVSTYNDDASDNDFAKHTERYPRLEEDEPPERSLVADYPRIIESLRSDSDELS